MEFNLSMLFKHKTSDVIRNFSYQLRSFFRYHTYRDGEIRKVTPPEGYEVSFEDNFSGPLNTEEWRYAMPWGSFHPDNLTQYYDTDGTLSYVNEKGLNLDLVKKPKTFIKSELPPWQQLPDLPDEFTIPVGVGYVSTKRTWKYGWFESWIQIPEGQHYWPAFWTSGAETWPPEIDIFEAYSHITKKYGGNKITKLPNRNVRPNLHYGFIEDGTKDQYGSYNNQIAKVTERFVQYACHWERDFIKIYYDGSPVLICTDKKILDWFNRSDAAQFVILNHGLHEGYPDNPDESTMLVKSIRILQKEAS